ncbi:hypothetical protein BGZ63DRAFT_432319 [Mariannaea sp. PMI_226]|nr:hypothetical protein BGZ63DRAFT_432319 [Mariannaea sp. PMI_226]
MPPFVSSISDLYIPAISNIRETALLSPGNSTDNALKVICAWPVSGQYGPGTRILYYALIAACLLARRAEWLVNACLAAALLLPAVAAIHAIVLTALHVHNAVDMDIFGAFQLCSIGILAAPVTVMMSRTYFNDPGRNTIFLWALLIFVGMLCLAIEFYRAETFNCDHGVADTPISTDVSKFPLGNSSICHLPFRCSTLNGPVSPMRGGAADNVYIIPVPDKLTFGTATLLAAACCVHAVLCLVSMWDRIVEINWRRGSRRRDRGDVSDKVIQGTNGATPAMMKGINGRIQYFLRIIAIPIFGGVGLAILILGEINFYSRQVHYQTEPIASVGQWAPICGTFMALAGSLYILLAANVEAVKEGIQPNSSGHQCNCASHTLHDSSSNQSILYSRSSSAGSDYRHPPSSNYQYPEERRSTASSAAQSDSGNRHRVAAFLIAVGEWLGSPTRDFFDDSFKRGAATSYPEVPGELARNRYLSRIRERYSSRQPDARPSQELTTVRSYVINDASGWRSEQTSGSHGEESPDTYSPHSSHFSLAHGGSSSVQHGTHRVYSTSDEESVCESPSRHQDTLEVPSPVLHVLGRGRPSV